MVLATYRRKEDMLNVIGCIWRFGAGAGPQEEEDGCPASALEWGPCLPPESHTQHLSAHRALRLPQQQSPELFFFLRGFCKSMCKVIFLCEQICP